MKRTPPPLRFGIYPGGGVGTVDAAPTRTSPDELPLLDELRRLRGDRAFVLHLYTEIDGTDAFDGHLEWAEGEIARYAAEGFLVELVLRHKPVATTPREAVAGYVAGVRKAVQRLGGQPGLIGLQITNEANVTGAPDAADGAFPGARQALVQGLLAADQERRRLGLRGLGLGFNAAEGGGAPGFWSDLRKLGGKRFARAVDWVGIDVYPGTWSAPSQPSYGAVRKEVVRSLGRLRSKSLPAAGLGRRVALHVSENGYPTGPGRSEAAQVDVLRASVAAIDANRGRYGVTDYRWFDLRDADSSSREMEHQYGVLRSDGTPKAAFDVLRGLVARLGAAA